jgi:hypothetical protein
MDADISVQWVSEWGILRKKHWDSTRYIWGDDFRNLVHDTIQRQGKD